MVVYEHLPDCNTLPACTVFHYLLIENQLNIFRTWGKHKFRHMCINTYVVYNEGVDTLEHQCTDNVLNRTRQIQL